MGNFEKLGILVIIVLVVTIVVLAVWGMKLPVRDVDAGGPTTQLSGETVTPAGGATIHDPPVKPNNGRKTRDPNADHVFPDPPASGGHEGGRTAGGTQKIDVDALKPAPEPPEFIDHVLKPNENYYSLSRVYFHGSPNYWKEIAAANPGLSPENLPVGRTIRIPNPERILKKRVQNKAGPAANEGTPPPAGKRTYVVRKGDNLSRIAARELGSSSRRKEIYTLNRDQIGPDENAIRIGMKLVLPAK